MNFSRHDYVLLGILAIALLLRIAAACGVEYYLSRGADTGADPGADRAFLIAGDAEGYWELGKTIAYGKEYTVYSPPRRAMRMPGFPAVLAISIATAGENLLAARLLLAVVGVIACYLVYRLGVELFDRPVGLVAAGVAAVSPTMVVFSIVILSETLFAVAILASLLLCAKLVKPSIQPITRPRWLLAAATGAGFAAACYVRPSWLLAAPLFAFAWILFAFLQNKTARKPGTRITVMRKTVVVESVVIVCSLLACLLPWGARNKQATGHFVLTTLWAGPSLYDGLHPGATGESDMTFYDRDRLRDRLSEYETDRYYRRKAWQFAKENPTRTMELAVMKLWRYFKPWPNAEQFRGMMLAVIVAAFYLPMTALALIGAWRFRRRIWPPIIALGPLLYFAAIHAVFVASLRYRLPAEYPLYVLSAAAIISLVKTSPLVRRVGGTPCRAQTSSERDVRL